MNDIVEKVNLIKSDVNKNNNKFWNGTLYSNGDVFCEWGRVGDSGQSKMFPAAGKSFLDKKVREKTSDGRNGEIAYRRNDMIQSGATLVKNVSTGSVSTNEIRDIAKKQIKSNNPIVEKLIERLAKENAHNIIGATGGKISYNDTTGLFSTPLGIIGQEAIDKANDVLVEIGDLVSKQKYDEKIKNLTNDYLMLVPTEIGRTRLDVREFWRDIGKVQYQKQIVDSLQASLASATSTPNVKTAQVDAPKVFDCQLNLVEDGREIDRIKRLYKASRKDVHVCAHLDVKTVFTVSINTVKEEFEKDGKKMKNIMDLWHGTKTCNLLSILKQGLVLPRQTSAAVTGAMFGSGIYAASASTKSLNYAYGYWSGSRNDNCFMFLIKMAMGNYHVPRSPTSSHPPHGYDSYWAKANTSGVANDEFIVFRTSQVDLVHLIEFSPNGR